MTGPLGSRLGRTLLSTIATAAMVALAPAPSHAVGAASHDNAAPATSGSSSQPPALGQLPWEGIGDRADDPSQPRLTGPRELLELYGIDAGLLASLKDGEPVGVHGEDALLRILHRLPRFPLAALHRWRSTRTRWAELVEKPSEHRAEIVSLVGRVKRVDRTALLPELAERLEFDHFYRVTMRLDDAPYPAVVCTRAIPQAWRAEDSLDERAGATALFVKVGDKQGPQPELVFVAPRAMWFPDRVDPARDIASDQVYLATLGLDIGLFDDVRARNGKPLGVQDRECFYQLLASVGRAPEGEFQQHASPALDLASLLNAPGSHHGRLMTVRGAARRVTRVVVAERDVQERLGIDHYYQLDVVVPLGDQVIRLGAPQPGKDVPTFSNTFPVVVCTLRLPAGLAEGNDLRQEVRIPAAFLKLWAFRSEYVAAIDPHQLQPAPLFIARTPQLVSSPPPLGDVLGVASAVIFLLVLVGLWYGVVRWGRTSERVRRLMHGRRGD